MAQADTSVAVCGMGWFPDQPGGLNRYVRNMLENPVEGLELQAVVVGPASDPLEGVWVSAPVGRSLFTRLRSFARAADEVAGSADVLDVHFPLYGLLPALRNRKLPCLVHFHGPWAEESAAAGERRLTVAVKRALERRLYRRAQRFIVLSRPFKDVLAERYGVPPWDVEVVPPGVDLDRFRPGEREAARARLGLGDGDWVVFSARRLIPRMGIDDLLRAFATIDREGAVLLVAGDGPERLTLTDEAAELGLEDRVRFLGRIEDAALVDCYRAADVSVVPSRSLEGFGLVVLESLACGTPVLATDVGGLRDVLGGLDSSLLVPAGDPEALRCALRDAADGRAELPSPEACRRYAEGFTWRAAMERHRDIYRSLDEAPKQRRLRVVYLDHCGELSGGELALLRLLPALEDVEPLVILGEEGPLAAKLRGQGIPVETLEIDERVRRLTRQSYWHVASPLVAFQALGYAFRLARRLRRVRPDLVHTNSLKSALYGGVAGRLVGVPVVWHVRDRLAADYLPGRAAQLVRVAARFLPTAVIANSETTLDTVGPLRRPAAVVPSPLDAAFLAASPAADRNGPLTVTMVGRISRWKGQDLFLRAFARAFPSGKEHALIVGGAFFGEDEFESELVELARELGIAERVTFLPFQDDVAAVLRRSTIFVHASVIPEPFGQVVVEAMAAGTPVIVPAAGGPNEIVEDGVTGVTYRLGDEVALAAALRGLAADEDLRRSLSRAARERAEEFAPERVAPAVLSLYRAALRGAFTP